MLELNDDTVMPSILKLFRIICIFIKFETFSVANI